MLDGVGSAVAAGGGDARDGNEGRLAKQRSPTTLNRRGGHRSLLGGAGLRLRRTSHSAERRQGCKRFVSQHATRSMRSRQGEASPCRPPCHATLVPPCSRST